MTEQPDTTAIRAAFQGADNTACWMVLDLCDALDAARAKYDEIGDEVREMDVQIWIGKYRDEQARAEAAGARIANALKVLNSYSNEGLPATIRRALTGGTE